MDGILFIESRPIPGAGRRSLLLPAGIHATSVQSKTPNIAVQGNVNTPHTGIYAFGSGSSVKAIFEPVAATYLVTVNGSYASPTGAGSFPASAVVTIQAGSRSTYSFAGWTSSDVAITNAGSKNASSHVSTGALFNMQTSFGAGSKRLVVVICVRTYSL